MPSILVPYPHQLLGQEELVAHFSSLKNEGRLPHALLLTGEDGGEALPLAMVLARQILCEHPDQNGLPCGVCSDCRMIDGLEHPDLTFVYPVVKLDDQTTSPDYLKQFRALLASHERFSESEWRDEQAAKNKQLQIMVAEAERLIKFTSLRSFKSRHQVIIVWLPELMGIATANKLLKLLEEPPAGVIFIMVSHDPQKLLPTILSRLQRVPVPSIPENILSKYMMDTHGVPSEEAKTYAHLSQGNLYRALDYAKGNTGDLARKEEAIRFLLLPFKRDPRLFLEESRAISKLNRPDVLALLETIPLVLREALALHYGSENEVYLPQGLKQSCRAISDILSPDGYVILMDELVAAQNEIRQNANVRMVFFDLFLKIAMLYNKR